MIISEKFKLVFIHIPKCAGTSVRDQLAPYDSLEGSFNRVVEINGLGTVDLTHMPLSVLNDHFPEQMQKTRDYDSYAVIRDPYARFESSLRQHLLMYKQEVVGNQPNEERLVRAQSVMQELDDTHSKLLPARLAHFHAQHAFVDLDGTRIVGNIYLVEALPQMFAELNKRTGLHLDGHRHSNRNLNFRFPALTTLAYKSNDLLKACLPMVVHDRLKKIVMPAIEKAPAPNTPDKLTNHPSIRNFVERYYARDIDLYHEVSARMAA